MALDFTVKDIIHKVTAKFVQAFLPEAKKKYHLKAVLQPELDIHEIASKAEVYNITTSPKVIEEGLLAGAELAFYLLADGYKLKLPFCTMGIRLPGEYDGSENRLPPDVYPEVRFQTSFALRSYIKDKVHVVFDGVDTSEGFIGEIRDETTGLIDQTITQDGLLTLHGIGLKIESDPQNEAAAGVFFETAGQTPVKAKALAVNEPRTLKVLAPMNLQQGVDYRILIVTQSSSKGGGSLLKNLREVRSEAVLTVHP